jgi:hypothetical protein
VWVIEMVPVMVGEKVKVGIWAEAQEAFVLAAPEAAAAPAVSAAPTAVATATAAPAASVFRRARAVALVEERGAALHR